MLKEILLISAITFAPQAIIQNTGIHENPVVYNIVTEGDTEPTTPPTEETDEPTTPTTEETDKPSDTDLQTWLLNFFDANTVATIMSWVAYIATIIGLVIKLKSLANSKSMTIENVKNAIDEELKKNKIELSEEQKSNIEAYLPSLLTTAKNQNDILQVLIKIIVLMEQEDTTGANKLAIFELISKLGVIDKEITNSAVKNVQEQVETNKAKKQEAVEKVDNLIVKTTKSDDGTSI